MEELGEELVTWKTPMLGSKDLDEDQLWEKMSIFFKNFLMSP